MEYRYSCPMCGGEIIITRTMDTSGSGLVVCEPCGIVANRIYEVPPISFKGKGFYVNDSRQLGSTGSTDRE